MSHLVLFQVLTQCLAAAIQLLKCLTSKILTVCQNEPPAPATHAHMHACTHYSIHKPRNVRNLCLSSACFLLFRSSLAPEQERD